MATESQIRANRENAQHSTGPTSEAGKAASCMNNFRFGFTGVFTVLPSEDQEEFDWLFHGLCIEHDAKTITERLLVEKMAQSYWLSKRAVRLQDESCTDSDLTPEEQQRRLALFLRYQTTNDRAFHRSLNDLLKLRAERRKAEIGFESQERKRKEEAHKEAGELRREAAEKRKEERHKWDIMLAEAKVDHQICLTNNLDLDKVIAEAREEQRQRAQKAA